jgi:hypothetical protein
MKMDNSPAGFNLHGSDGARAFACVYGGCQEQS